MAAIIISVLIAIFLVVDIILLVHYNNSQPRNTNYSFLTDLLQLESASLMPRATFVNIASALSLSYSDLWFQSASLVSSWKAPPLTLEQVGNFFGDSSDHQLFIFSLTDGTTNYVAAAYSNIGFPLPSGWADYLADPTHDYFTFEIGTDYPIQTTDNRPLWGATPRAT